MRTADLARAERIAQRRLDAWTRRDTADVAATRIRARLDLTVEDVFVVGEEIVLRAGAAAALADMLDGATS